ncbi:LOW QUALITY PROTEIN: putative inner membrane protein [Geomicrobium sp. JCM 19038]|nr:LOW QUALITY PROTEIN: putative inner membrane protein [Geomicrobium sp. JCM 19038]
MKHQSIAEQDRIHTLDIIRGIAILGIAMANMMHFKTLADLDMMTMIEGRGLPEATLDALSSLFITFFVEGKFYPMFSLLFGLGFYIFYSRTLEKDLNANRLFSRRLTFLIIIGLLHQFLFWHGDILFTYGVTGFLLLLFISRQPKTILLWATLMLAISSFFYAILTAGMGLLFGLGKEAMSSKYQSANNPMKWRMGIISKFFFIDYLESFLMIFNVFMVIPTILPLFLLGLYFGKTGMFHNVEEHVGKWKKICIHTAWSGILLSVLTTALIHDFFPIPPGVGYGLGTGIRMFTGPILMLFFVSAFVLLLRKESRQAMLKPIAAVGRMALTNYLMQTLIFVFIFHGYGLGLFNQVGSFIGLVISVLVFGLQILFSTLYLKKFKQGPMETLWRKWTYKNA